MGEVKNAFSPNPSDWQLSPTDHVEINYLDRDDIELRLVVYDMSVISSSENSLRLSCLSDIEQGKLQSLPHLMELSFSKNIRTGQWHLRPRVFGVRVPDKKAQARQKVPWGLRAFNALLFIWAGYCLGMYLAGIWSGTEVARQVYIWGFAAGGVYSAARYMARNSAILARKYDRWAKTVFVIVGTALVMQLFLISSN